MLCDDVRNKEFCVCGCVHNLCQQRFQTLFTKKARALVATGSCFRIFKLLSNNHTKERENAVLIVSSHMAC